jgi:hypothetical protein
MIASIISSVQKTLSTLVWLPVLCARRVGMNGGSTIFMLCLPSMLSRGCVRFRLSRVKRCVFLGSSHSRWCRLKSPRHMVCSGPTACSCLSQSRMNADMCVSAWLLLQSLYIFISCNIPKQPWISIAIMSRCWNWICFHESISRLALMRVTDLVLSGYSWCVLGYTTVQCWFAHILPLRSIYGSCIVHTSYSSRLRLWSRSSWLIRDLLMFCCRICSGLWGVSCSGVSGIFEGCVFPVGC